MKNREPQNPAVQPKISIISRFSTIGNLNKQPSLHSYYFNNNFFQLQVGDLKTTFRNFEDVRFEGQWEKTASGATFKGLGDVNALKHAFEAAYISKASGFSVTWLVVIMI